MRLKEPSHIDERGKAKMVDTSGKNMTRRKAAAAATVRLNEAAFEAVAKNQGRKGDVLAVAQIAGIQAAKKTADLIPLCHSIPLDYVEINFNLDDKTNTVEVRAVAECTARTGVEMEALTACAVAALTVYDMLKAVQRDIVISDIMLLEKKGGRSGEYRR